MTERVVDRLVTAMADAGIRRVFGVDGANIEDLYDAVARGDGRISALVAKHEFSAGTMADGYARTTGRPAAVAVTSGGGSLNLVAALGEAYASRVPMLALVGQIPTALEGGGGFQDSSGLAGSIDAARLFGTVSRYCARVDKPAELGSRMREALDAAHSGPAVLLLPKDVQQSPAADAGESDQIDGTSPEVSSAELTALGRLLAAVDGPIVVLAGDEVARAGARTEFAALVDRLDAFVAVAPDAKDVFENRHPRFLGVAGVMGGAVVARAVQEAATVLLVGTRLPVMARGGLDDALRSLPVLSIGSVDPYVCARHVEVGDLAGALTRLLALLPDLHRPMPDAVPREPRRVPDSPGVGIRYGDAVAELATAVPPGSQVFVDAGNTGAAVVHQMDAPSGGRFVVALGMGGMGYSFGAGIGAAFGARKTTEPGAPPRTFVVAGDGAFFMHGMEIHTAVEHTLPITFVIFNNNAHAMCVTREQLYFSGEYSYNRFRPARIGEGLAAMFPGIAACSVHGRSELHAALAPPRQPAGPAVIDVECDPDEIPPFAPFLQEVHGDHHATAAR